MRVSVLTLFPELIEQVMSASVVGRAWKKNLFDLELVQIRDFAVNTYGKVDDYCYGGGTGMLLMAPPILAAWQEAVRRHGLTAPAADQQAITRWRSDHPECRTFYLSPRGETLTQAGVIQLAEYDHLILLCGHYEGVDQRVLDLIIDGELSIGDYVLTGGEIAACVVMDAVFRLLPGVLPNQDAYEKESHMAGRLEQAQYTRPVSWLGIEPPDVLLSGHEAKIEQWQASRRLAETLRRRPDLLKDFPPEHDEWRGMLEIWTDADDASEL
ncbi:MAG: tRNA (guanosine(37)-N1)-methyltransferase TrmD [Eubacteriales bacterium]|nr:tRNA (guanosine(37)-N1)-methyltransferase TrmD [Eubacteriales bacterium]MDD3867595.1 tRNA (guanosine(37)-N1)-methyltransferase TrmD [Eubacteriales bacterium]MDD4461932.1 tRNA (guanosine(37)-N1)-methyltransferase TrmD [Eubacteriales bacterium]